MTFNNTDYYSLEDYDRNIDLDLDYNDLNSGLCGEWLQTPDLDSITFANFVGLAEF